MSTSLSLDSDKKVIVGKTLKHMTKLLDRLHGIGRGYGEGMESRSIIVLANGIPQVLATCGIPSSHKLREELKNDGALLFGLMFLAYLDIGGEYFC